MNGIIDVTEKRSLPVRIYTGFKTGVCNALGQLASRDFWLDLGAKVIREMINAFMKTLGAKFLTMAVSREDPEIKRAAAATVQQNGGGSSAFSNPAAPTYNGSSGYGSASGYRNDYNRYPPAPVPAPRTDAKFPGF